MDGSTCHSVDLSVRPEQHGFSDAMEENRKRPLGYSAMTAAQADENAPLLS